MRPARKIEPLLLDTHAWVWLMEGVDRLSKATVRRIEESARDAALLVSAMSVWEVGMLEARGRLTLSRAVDEWVHGALTAPGVRLAELTPAIALESTRLPGQPPSDPADRMLIATARILGASLVTCDERILGYAASGYVRVRDGGAFEEV